MQCRYADLQLVATKTILFQQDEAFTSVESFESREKLQDTMKHWTHLSPSKLDPTLAPTTKYTKISSCSLSVDNQGLEAQFI